MTIVVVWLIVFGVVLALALKSWEGMLGRVVTRWLPASLRSGDDQDRWVVAVALAVLAATFIVAPISMILTLILIALLVWLGVKVGPWIMKKVKLH
ncbi:hypothetical protein [Salinicola aestuarinus]|uniref:hypothetical protein n=1 Tax=Salinicola aestuarinus TaxID=1949082 RepID=UPI000DA1349D|nr:hypothetical protein [Salinicola aestuarinus]